MFIVHKVVINMTESIIVALITLVGVILSNYFQSKKSEAVQEEKLKEIAKRLDEHNGYAEKFAKNSEQIAEIKKDIAVIKTTLDFIKNTR